MENSINLSESRTIPKEGYFKPNGTRVTLVAKCNNLSAASTTITPKAGPNTTVTAYGDLFGTMKENGDNLSLTLTSGVAMVESFDVDDDILMKFTVADTVTGTVYYNIIS